MPCLYIDLMTDPPGLLTPSLYVTTGGSKWQLWNLPQAALSVADKFTSTVEDA
jgi:hypothetical protein